MTERTISATRRNASDADTQQTKQTNEQPPDATLWATVELMGHDRTAGRYSFVNGLHRIDVPRPDGSFVTEMLGSGSIFRIRFVDEAAARLAARSLDPQPIGVWELKKELARLNAPAGETLESREYEYFDEDEEL